MTAAAGSLQVVPQSPPSAPALRAADQGVADALELSSPTTPAASTQPSGGCSPAGATTWTLRSLSADPLTVALYLAGRVASGASIATMRLATSAITKAHEWAGHERPARIVGYAPL